MFEVAREVFVSLFISSIIIIIILLLLFAMAVEWEILLYKGNCIIISRFFLFFFWISLAYAGKPTCLFF